MPRGRSRRAFECLERVIEVGGQDDRELRTGDPVPLAEVEPDGVAWLFYTSGTTGRPKGAMLTHRNLLAMTLSYFADVDQIVPGDAILHAAPMSHGSGLYILPHAAKAACQIVPASGGFDPAEVFELLGCHRGVTLFGAPTMVKRLAGHPRAGRSGHPGLKTIVYGGGPMYQADLERAQAMFGYRLAQIYGQGESPMCITALDQRAHADVSHPRHRERLASVGTAQVVVEVRVADEDDRPLPAGEPGEVLVRGRERDARLLAGPRGERHDAARRLAAHRRCRRHGRGRLSHAPRSRQGPDHLGRHRTSIRARSRRSCSSIPRSRRSRWSASPTPNGARPWWPSW